MSYAPKGRVAVAGAVARRAQCGGHVWALLHWTLGFQRLGWDVVFLDHVDETPSDAELARYLGIMDSFGLRGSFHLSTPEGTPDLGLSRRLAQERLRSSDLLMNVMGYLNDQAWLELARHRVFLDIDPGFGQMWKELGYCDIFAGHHDFVTVGTAVGRDDCDIPTGGLPWLTTLPPVRTDLWMPPDESGNDFTTVASWRGPFAPVEFERERYGLRVHQFRRFLSLPERTGLTFRAALRIDESDRTDRDRIEASGWELLDPDEVADTPDHYRDFVRHSGAEFTVAKDLYVRTRSGWFSDRTACYLAAGRPALVQDTGFDDAIPHGCGLVTFGSPEEAAERALDIHHDRALHSRSARALAEAYLSSDRVLPDLIDRLGSDEVVPCAS